MIQRTPRITRTDPLCPNTTLFRSRVGTDFTQKVAAALFKRLDKMKQTKSPFAKKLTAEAARQVVFVRPELVAEVEFRAWTADGSVRHAAYRGLRDDKAPEEVVRESATAAKGKAAGKAAPAIRQIGRAHV